MKLTIKDIAQQAGVSTATVSRVINNSGYVCEKTKNIVLEIINKNNYIPKKRKSNDTIDAFSNIILGIISDPLMDAYVDYQNGMAPVFRDNNYHFVTMASYNDHKKEEDFLEYAINSHFAGVIMTGATESHRLVNLIEKSDVPIVLLNRYLRAPLPIDVVTMDNIKTGYMATSYLIKNGHTKIALVGGQFDSTPCQDRTHGFNDALFANNIKSSDAIRYYGDISFDFGVEVAKKILKENRDITAVFAHSDCIAAGVVDTYMKAGYSIPDDLSIITVDNTRFSKYGPIGLTTVYCDSHKMGEVAAEQLITRLRNPDANVLKLEFTPQLIERDSVKNILKTDVD